MLPDERQHGVCRVLLTGGEEALQVEAKGEPSSVQGGRVVAQAGGEVGGCLEYLRAERETEGRGDMGSRETALKCKQS